MLSASACGLLDLHNSSDDTQIQSSDMSYSFSYLNDKVFSLPLAQDNDICPFFYLTLLETV